VQLGTHADQEMFPGSWSLRLRNLRFRRLFFAKTVLYRFIAFIFYYMYKQPRSQNKVISHLVSVIGW